MLDYQDYTIDSNHYQGNGNGYDQLEGDYALFYRVAKGFVRRVKPEDRQDFLHDLILAMAEVKARYDVKGKPLTEAGIIRVACYEVADYWRKQFRRTNSISCGSCGKAQRQKCKDNLYTQCPKAIKIESLDRLIEDSEGNKVELYQMLADDKAVDIVAMLDARMALRSYPRQAVLAAYKRCAGYPLTNAERACLDRQRRKTQKRLVLA